MTYNVFGGTLNPTLLLLVIDIDQLLFTGLPFEAIDRSP